MTMDRLTYSDLIACYGRDSAQYVLRAIERLAEIKNDIQSMDCETRLQAALDALNDVDCATRH